MCGDLEKAILTVLGFTLEEYSGGEEGLDLDCLSSDEVTMKEMGRNQQLRTGEVLIIVVVLFMWAGEFPILLSAVSLWEVGGLDETPFLQKERNIGPER